ncbi:MAG: hypothetical protein ACRC1K_25755, partial [Planctomycetia bacterium]
GALVTAVVGAEPLGELVRGPSAWLPDDDAPLALTAGWQSKDRLDVGPLPLERTSRWTFAEVDAAGRAVVRGELTMTGDSTAADKKSRVRIVTEGLAGRSTIVFDPASGLVERLRSHAKFDVRLDARGSILGLGRTTREMTVETRYEVDRLQPAAAP